MKVHVVTCLLSIPLQLSVKVKGRRMLKAVTMATRRIELQGLGFEDSRRDKPIFRSERTKISASPISQDSFKTCHFLVRSFVVKVRL